MLTQITILIIDTNPLQWYSLGQTFTTIFDEYVGSYLAIDNGGAGRYIDSSHCEELDT